VGARSETLWAGGERTAQLALLNARARSCPAGSRTTTHRVLRVQRVARRVDGAEAGDGGKGDTGWLHELVGPRCLNEV
jgi:hypothetical protein